MTGVVVLHSTEGSSLDGAVATLKARGVPSHDVVDVREREIVQLVSYDRPAKALLNRPGGVETNNRGGVIQVEIVGFASRSTAEAARRPEGPILPEFDDDELAWLGQYLRDVCTRRKIPFVFPCPFRPYPQSYGANGVRLSFERWLRVEGVIGHQHVPENVHGDPGALDVARLIALSAPAPAQLHPLDMEALLMATSAFQLIGGNVYTFVPGQRAVSMGGIGAVHVALNGSGVAPVAGTVPANELEEFVKRWDAAVA